MASVPDSGVDIFLTSLISGASNWKYKQYHVGGYKNSDDSSNTFWAFLDGAIWGYENWGYGSPSGGGEGCLTIGNLHKDWNDVSCTGYQTYFICSKSA